MKKVAIIGLGNIGKAIAINLIKNKHEVIVASRNIDDATTFSQTSEVNGFVIVKEIEDAINEADIVIPAIWFTAYPDFFTKYETLLKDKIIIDVSNPIIPDGKGGLQRVIEENKSAGMSNALLLPKGAKLVKALGSLTVESLRSKSNQNIDLFYAADDIEIKEDIEKLIENSGFNPIYIGGIDQSIRMEVGGDLHEINTK